MTDFFSATSFEEFFKGLEKEAAPFWSSFETRVSDVSRAIQKVKRSEADGVVTLTTDLPGVKKDSLKVSFEDLEGGGTRFSVDAKRDDTDLKFSVKLNDRVQADAAAASLEDGVLTVTVPTVEATKPTVTEVKVS